jgi:recombination protein RecT
MEQQLATQEQEGGIQRIKNYMLSPEVRERFTDMMGANGIYYLNQVMIVVANSDKLQECNPKSILVSAMRAASLKLSVDPTSGQAWIIPYKGQATFQIGYRGIYELAMRTNQYRFINVIDIYEGEEVTENRMTGIHTIGGTRTGDKSIGRMLYFQLFTGFEKTFYMTTEEIDAHAKKYSPSYKYSTSKWNDPYERPKMERKTVLSNGLRKWGRFNASDMETLNQIEEDQGWLEKIDELPKEGAVTITELPKKTEAEIMSGFGFDDDKVKDDSTYTEKEIYAAGEIFSQIEQKKFCDIPSVELQNSLNRIVNSLKGKKPNDKTAEVMNAIEIVLIARSEGRMNEPKAEQEKQPEQGELV